MTSRDQFGKEIEIDLQKYWLVIKRRWLLIAAVCGVTTALSAVAASQQSDEYQAESRLLFESSNQTSALVGLERDETELKALTKQANPLDTQVELFRSIPVAQEVINRLQLKDSEGDLLDPITFSESLEVYPVTGTDVMTVSYTSPDPELSAAVVNLIMDVYIQKDIQANRAAAISAQQFIDNQLPQSERAVDQAEAALRQFKENNGVVDLEAESQSAVSLLSNFQSWTTELSSSLAGVEARIDELQGNLGLSPQQAYAVGLVSEAPGVQELLTQLQTVQAEMAIAQTRYEENHPAIINMSAQLASLFSLLEQRVGAALGDKQAALPVTDLQAGELEQTLIAEYLDLNAQRSELERRLGEVTSARAAQQSRAQVLPGLEKQQRELERRLIAAQSTYETLLESFQEAKVLENESIGNARVVSPALVPTESLAPPINLYLLAGGFLGAILGIILAFLLDLADRSVKSVQEGQEAYDYPLLGVIPAWAKLKPSVRSSELENPQILVEHPQAVPIVEAYQALQANLKFACPDKPLKTIAVTSAVAGEGKSEVSANLALTLAHLGHRVLVIDADMRLPTQHHIWDITEQQGLSNFAVGQLSLKNAIVLKGPNLHVLPVGSVPPNPLAILESKQVSALIRACEKAYDYIIIDTPALLGLADTLTIGRLTDGLLMVMQPGRVDVESINAAKSTLDQSGLRVLGLVANGVKVRSQADRYFYHRQEYIEASIQNSEAALPSRVSEPVAMNGRR
ncbi:MAG: polysaccharide biosynthesis tyrosine autokinase [Cyanobacteria bacterium J06614_10]